MHYIYHIPGVKIGCTRQLEKRMADQGFSEWEILEQHEDGWHAGDREIELQIEMGYPVDTCHYMVALENRAKGRAKIPHSHFSEMGKIGGAIGGKKSSIIMNQKLTKEQRAVGFSTKVECPHCGKTGGLGPMTRFHFENCKYKE